MECPLKLVGDENDPSNVVIEMGGTLIWKASSGWCEGVTFRRPKIASGEPTESSILQVHSGGKLDIIESIFDNSGHSGTVVNMLGTGEKGSWKNVSVKGGDGGIHMDEGASLDLLQVRSDFPICTPWYSLSHLSSNCSAALRQQGDSD